MRNYKRKTPKRDPAVLRGAVATMKSGVSLRAVSNRFGVPRSTLLLHRRNNETIVPDDLESTHLDTNDLEIAPKGYKRVFTEQQEGVLKHLLHVANDYFGLTAKQARSLAYQYVKEVNVVRPCSWHRDEMAGLDRYRSFKIRQPKLMLTKPEQHLEHTNVAEN